MRLQGSPVPGKIDLSLVGAGEFRVYERRTGHKVAGVALPTEAVNLAGPGAQPYLQMPWSWELHDGWGLSGMLTEFFRPSDSTTRSNSQAPTGIRFVNDLTAVLTSEVLSVLALEAANAHEKAGVRYVRPVGRNFILDCRTAFSLCVCHREDNIC